MRLGPGSRIALVVLGAAAIVTSFFSVARGGAIGATSAVPSPALRLRALTLATEALALPPARHDPFAIPATPAPLPSSGVDGGWGALPVLPPNRGASGTPLAPLSEGATGLDGRQRLAGIALGEHPVAAIDDGATVRFVRPGDRLGNDRITEIERDAVRFESGRRLAFVEKP